MMDLETSTDPTTPSPATAILDRWERLTGALQPATLELLDTEDIVSGLIDRSLLQDELDSGVELGDVDLRRLDTADRALRAAAPVLIDRTQVALFRDDEPALHWWWHLEELVLGKTSSDLLDVQEAATLKVVHPHTIRLAIKDGLLPARRLARGFLIHRRDLERWQPRRVGRPKGSGRRAVDTLLESFNEASTRGDFVRARQIAAAIALDASTPRRKLAVALAHYNAEEYDVAFDWTRRALEGELPDVSRRTALLIQGRCLLAAGRPKDAGKVLRKAQAIGDDDALVSAALADTHLALDDTSKAVEYAAHAVSLAPEEPELRYLLARMEWHANEIGDALEHVMECRVKRPDHEEATLLYAGILGLLGDRTGDSTFHRRAAAAVAPLAESSPDAAQALGTAWSRLDREDEAIMLLERIIAEHPADDQWLHAAEHIGFAILLDSPIDDRGALALVDRIAAAIGDTVFVVQRRAFVHAWQGHVDRVLEELKASLDDPEGMDAVDRAIVLVAVLQAGQSERGLAVAKAVIHSSEGPDVTHVAVRVALAAGDLDLAQEGLVRLREEPGLVGFLADNALELRQASEKHGRDEAHLARVLSALEPTQVDAPVTERLVATARGSAWEGQHAPMTAVLDRLISVVH